MNIWKLHTKSTRKYRGKYPTRLHDFSNGGRGNAIVERHLNLKAAHFLELNNGDRYYADGFWMKSYRLPITSRLLFKFDFGPMIEHATELPAAKYNAMIDEINADRARRRDEHNAAVNARKHARERSAPRAIVVPTLTDAQIKFIRFCENEHGASRGEHETITGYISRLRGDYA